MIKCRCDKEHADWVEHHGNYYCYRCHEDVPYGNRSVTPPPHVAEPKPSAWAVFFLGLVIWCSLYGVVVLFAAVCGDSLPMWTFIIPLALNIAMNLADVPSGAN